MKYTIAVSIGDVNGVGPELALRAHRHISALCNPCYYVPTSVMKQAADLLNIRMEDDMCCAGDFTETTIIPGALDVYSGKLSFASFRAATDAVATKKADALVTLPINKKAWELAGVPYKGHTDALSAIFNTPAIMMLGSAELYVALFTDHIPLNAVCQHIQKRPLADFLVRLYRSSGFRDVAVLGLNPHAGDGGVLGCEEKEIVLAIKQANETIGFSVYSGPIVPDVAFTPAFRHTHRYIVALYHDQGLAPLKALYFDQAINVSLGLPIIRTSPDHGTAFDIAYKGVASLSSYINAVTQAVRFVERNAQASFL